jgi:hypothetical protein
MRIRLLPVSAELLVAMAISGTTKTRVRENALPEGTRVIEVRCDPIRFHQALFVIEHPSFDEVREADVIPWHPTPVFEAIP